MYCSKGNFLKIIITTYQIQGIYHRLFKREHKLLWVGWFR